MDSAHFAAKSEVFGFACQGLDAESGGPGAVRHKDQAGPLRDYLMPVHRGVGLGFMLWHQRPALAGFLHGWGGDNHQGRQIWRWDFCREGIKGPFIGNLKRAPFFELYTFRASRIVPGSKGKPCVSGNESVSSELLLLVALYGVPKWVANSFGRHLEGNVIDP